jgi:hypothetical protein
MKRFLKVMGILSIAMVLVVGLSYGQAKKAGLQKISPSALEQPKNQNSDPVEPDAGNKDIFAATPNLSFPIIATDILQMFYLQTWIDSDGDGVVDESEWVIDYDLDDDGVNEITEPTPIEVTEVINVQYSGYYPGNDDAFFSYYTLGEDGCATDINGDGIIDDLDLTSESMLTWLQSMQPWYDQPVTTTDTDPNLIWNADYVDAANSWQADWVRETEAVITIDFIDWGNPLENNVYPIVGMRFPVEVALYEKLETPMTAYKMACLENPGTKDELFGTSVVDGEGYTTEVAFATVLTNKFFCEVWNPGGSITKINIEPGIGPSGKMNFASAGGGWIPTVAGWHRIWLHLNDPLISLSGAIVNNDEHYIMSTGCMVQELNKNKQELVGIIGDSTYIDVLVKLPNGGKIK